ncbi:ankyrin repeat domain-containing protein [Streptosporangium sp. NPDC000239]|uniref:ankyrin repeat domain-containing protein n=1 Tax=Streptosporangium sp. NPDC000239 TaxID=3154248 RepID=UPI003327FDB3
MWMRRRAILLSGLGLLAAACGGRTVSRTVKGEKVLNDELLTRAARGDVAGVRDALTSGADVGARDGLRRTALLLAVAGDHVEVAELLIAAGADPNALDSRHDTPWLVTGVTGSVAMLKALLPGRPDLTIRNRYGGVSLIPACERGHVDYVREVLKTGIKVDHVNDLGWTGLLEAIILGDGGRPYQEIVRLLIAAGADVDLGDREGVTPLAHAVSRRQTAVAGLLRAAGAH